VTATPIEAGIHVDLTLTGTLRLADALNQVYVLLPVLDDAKHYWVAPDEVDKLLRAGTGWLAVHPQRALIARRVPGAPALAGDGCAGPAGRDRGRGGFGHGRRGRTSNRRGRRTPPVAAPKEPPRASNAAAPSA
jgi:hypothetical protein